MRRGIESAPPGRDHEVGMIRYEYVGMKGAFLGSQYFTQPSQENLPVVVAEKHRLPVVAPLHYGCA